MRVAKCKVVLKFFIYKIVKKYLVLTLILDKHADKEIINKCVSFLLIS